jgi:WD40 repeat protein
MEAAEGKSGFWIAPVRPEIVQVGSDGLASDTIVLERPCRRVCPSRAGALALAMDDRRVRVVPMTRGGFSDLGDGGPGALLGLVWTPDGKTLLGGFTQGVTAWRGHPATRIWQVRTREPARSISVSADGTLLALAGPGGAVSILATGSGRTVGQIAAHRGTTTSVEFSRSGSLLVSAGDRTVMVHDVEAWGGAR